ncbi:MAG: hypothetical protein QW290_02585 [Sulfolobales archaeon]
MKKRMTLMILAILLTIIPAHAQSPPQPSTEQLLMVYDTSGTLVGVFPQYQVYYLHRNLVTSNDTSVQYRVVSRWWTWVRAPPTQVSIPELEGEILLSSKVDLLSSVFQTSNTSGVSVEVRVVLQTTIKKIKNVTGLIPLGDYISQYGLGGDRPTLLYVVEVEKYVGGSLTSVEEISEEVELNMDFTVDVSTLRIGIRNTTLERYEVFGSLDAGAVIAPTYKVFVCGEVLGSMESGLTTTVYVAGSEATLTLSNLESCTQVSGVKVMPGERQNLQMLVSSGVFVLTINNTVSPEGYLVSFSKPAGVVAGGGTLWKFEVRVPIQVSGYFHDWPSVEVGGAVNSQVFGSIECSTEEIKSSGSYVLTCVKEFSGSVDPKQIDDSAYVEVWYRDELGGYHVLSGAVSMNVIDPTSLSDMTWEIHQHSVRILLFGMFAVLALYVLSLLKESITGFPLIDNDYLRGTLLTLSVSVVIFQVVFPISQFFFISIIRSLPPFQSYVTDVSGTDPKSLLTSMINYYDKLFLEIQADYYTEYVTSLNNIIAHIGLWIAGSLTFMLIAIALSTPFTPGGGIPFASLFSAVLSLVFGIVGLLITQVQTGALVLLGVIIARVFILVVSALIVVLMTIGVFLVCVPSPLSQRIGEDLIGAGVLFFLTFPLLGPITYAFYMYLIDSGKNVMAGPLQLSLGLINIVFPVTEFIKIIIYLTSTTLAVVIVVSSLAYILTRTGIATGIGEAFSGLFWRA